MLEARQVEPARRESHIGAGGKEQPLAAFVEDGIAGIADAVGDLRFLAGVERIHEHGTKMISEELRVGQPFAVRRPAFIHRGSWIVEAVRGNFYRHAFFQVHVPQV